MKVELRKVSINKRLSQETTCFSADIWIDGKKVGEAANRGHGGPNEIYIKDKAVYDAFNAFCLSQSPHKSQYGDLDMDMDFYISLLLEKVVERQTLKRRKGTTFFRLKNEKYQTGEWRTAAAPFSPAVKDYLVKKYGDNLGEIINESF